MGRNQKGLNNMREVEWKNKNGSYANASNFAKSDEDFVARAGGYGAELMQKEKEQKDEVLRQNNRELDQKAKMEAAAEKQRKQEQAKLEKGKELEQKRFAQDSVIEKRAKGNKRRRLE